ncbi:hypothetical protein [Mesorhizobium onobrychidis]|uniref:PIN domain-containing protein n=1 Tax=Mesorhizobium onobrychidis TaxID=2775404 RepID=A0ABY5QXX5_9HYPH|nr:hypothetical protein [Mesorhizobium onobrychidis]UVC15551.1 hypothetical protein IHQ72_34945 [Mesorhizobium onobrychidis]
MRPAFDHTDYSTILFMDSMVALEGKPLPTLPWKEIDPVGPILVLVVPQVSTEIDKRKRDGRLSKRAREFNRLISPAAETGQPARIAEGPPAVDIAVARTARIDWDKLNDLDPEEADARVVAQILHARDVPEGQKLLLSHDINPIAMASRHGLKCRKLPDAWLMEPEPSPSEKEMARLKARVKVLESAEPDLTPTLTFGVNPPVRIFRVGRLSDDQQKAVASLVLAGNRRVIQRHSSFPRIGLDFEYDSSYDDKYDTYRMKTVPKYAASAHRFFEVHYGQVPFTFELSNKGHRQAESLVLTLRATGGTLHDRFTLYPLFGPIAPRPQPHRLPGQLFDPRDLRTRITGRHEIDFAIGPDRGDTIEVHCADFRHGRSWTFNGIATIDPRAEGPFLIDACVTAGNMRGKIERSYMLAREVEDVTLGSLVDLGTKAYRIPIPMAELFKAESNAMNKDWFEFVRIDDMPEEDIDEDE